MKHSKIIAFAVAAAFGLGVSAMAQGRGGDHPMGGPPADAGPGMGGQGSGMGGQMGQMGQSGQSGQMGQTGQMRQQNAQSGPKSVSDLLTQNTKLSSQLQTILGQDVNLQQAASGFKNLGLFVAAVHVSKNLNIPFNDLSTAIQKDGNLGKAIHSVQPNLSNSQVKSAVRTANQQAKQDIRNSKS
jgi:hypothetical protein